MDAEPIDMLRKIALRAKLPCRVAYLRNGVIAAFDRLHGLGKVD